MKKMTLLSIAAAALLFVGCGDKKAEANATEMNATEVNATEANTTTAAPEANTTTAAPEANTTAAAPAATDAKTLYAACAACHGADGKTAALGKSAITAGQAKDVLLTKMKGYKAGTINLTGNGPVMQGQMANLNDEQMEALAEYISKL
ncbi:MAG: c-type cytochrome [Sulfurovaceae bacterium]|nr:c-type cytochrome [Sulfurovaceae bacterium]MDD5549436.1 c-type cytochrome [Sulfurovaceae bacterium]